MFNRSFLVGLLAAGLLLLGMSAAPEVARADEATQMAKKHFRTAQRHYKLGKFKLALSEFEKAYEAKEFPAFLFNIGQCHYHLKNYDRAIFFYEGYLRDKPNAKNAEAVQSLIADAKVKEQARARALAEAKRLKAEQEAADREAERVRLAAEAKRKQDEEKAKRLAAAERKRKADEEAARKKKEAETPIVTIPADPVGPAKKDPATASSASLDVPSKISSSGALWRSSLAPGWGQFASGHKVKGWVFAGAAGVSLVSLLITQAQLETAAGYVDTAGPLQRQAMYEQFEKHRNGRNISIALAVGVWTGAAVDAYLGARSKKSVTVAPTARPDGAGFVITGHF